MLCVCDILIQLELSFTFFTIIPGLLTPERESRETQFYHLSDSKGSTSLELATNLATSNIPWSNYMNINGEV